MDQIIVLLFVLFFVVRLATLFISIRNEKRLKAEGGVEYGKTNSLILAVLHVGFYLSALAEGYSRSVQFDQMAQIGAAIYVFAMLALFYIIYELSPLWTVKLIIAKHHALNSGWLFRYLRHPNYFINLIPELVGLAIMLKAYHTMLILFPLYLASLGVRIVQEERVMRLNFSDY